MKLYKHTTDGGAEYLTTVEDDLYTAVVRLDGEPELVGKFENIERVNANLLAALKAAVSAPHPTWCKARQGKDCSCYQKAARAAILSAEE